VYFRHFQALLWHQHRYVPKQLLPCRISADISKLIFADGCAVTVTPCGQLLLDLGFAEIFPR
jgi:hypothetical protein